MEGKGDESILEEQIIVLGGDKVINFQGGEKNRIF